MDYYLIEKGSNKPIVLEFDDNTQLQDFSASLISNTFGVMKNWRLANIQVEDNIVTLPQSQQDTIGYYGGGAKLEIKWIRSGGFVELFEVPYYIIDKQDVNILGG